MAGPQIGIIQDGQSPGNISAAIETGGGEPLPGEPASLPPDLDGLVVTSKQTIWGAIDQRLDVPLLPVGTIDGLATVPQSALAEAISAIQANQVVYERHPVLQVAVNDQIERGIYDVALITDAPAKISEFRVTAPADGITTQFRADGTVLATPAGSYGYASAAGAPRLGPESGVAVVPIAPFVINIDRWVIGDLPVEMTVCRDNCPVAVAVDGTNQATIYHEDTVRITSQDTVQVIRTSQSTRGNTTR